MSAIELQGISKIWGETTAVNDVSFSIDQGTFAVLLGPSGCGKSTSLRMISGLEEISQGKLVINGKDMTTASPAERHLSMVFQNYALFPHLNVEENILFGLKVRKTPKPVQSDRLQKVAQQVGLEQLLDRKPAQLSGGQRQRVALARAIIAENPICLMDEPLSNLDAKLRHIMRVEIRALQQRLGMTVIYVTHDQAEAMSMADRIVLMNDGKIEQIDVPEVLYSEPKTVFTAQFIGNPPMNILNFEDGNLGIRPEHVLISDQGMPARVISCDYHGADTIVLADVLSNKEQGGDQKSIKIRYPGHALFEENQQISISWIPENEHRFPM